MVYVCTYFIGGLMYIRTWQVVYILIFMYVHMYSGTGTYCGFEIVIILVVESVDLAYISRSSIRHQAGCRVRTFQERQFPTLMQTLKSMWIFFAVDNSWGKESVEYWGHFLKFHGCTTPHTTPVVYMCMFVHVLNWILEEESICLCLLFFPCGIFLLITSPSCYYVERTYICNSISTALTLPMPMSLQDIVSIDYNTKSLNQALFSMHTWIRMCMHTLACTVPFMLPMHAHM